jgi:two-component system cell cycle sensor histidine kinase/response regulator CckA
VRTRTPALASASLATGLVAIAVYVLLGPAGRTLLSLAIGLASVAAITVAVVRSPGAGRLPLALFGLGVACFVAGDAALALDDLVLGRAPPFPALPDVLSMAGYPLLIGSSVVFLRGISRRGGLGTLLDAVIVAGAAAAVLWLVALDSVAHGADASSAARAVALAYPALDVLLIALLLRLSFLRAPRNPAVLGVAAGFALLLAGDVGDAVLSLQGSYLLGSLADLGFLGAYVLWGACALHRSLPEVTAVEPQREGRLPSWRLTLIAASVLAVPLSTAFEAARGHEVNGIAVAVASALLTLLLLARILDLLRRNEGLHEDARRSELRFRELVGEVDAVVSEFDVEAQRFTFFSKQVERITGFAPEALAGPSERWLACIHPDDRQRVERRVRESVRVGSDYAFEYRVVRPNGQLVWLGASGRIARDGSGRPRFVRTISVDITRAKLAEQELRDREEHFRSLLENGTDVISVLDADGTLRYQSPSGERVFAWRSEDIVGRNVFDLVHPDDVPRVLEAFAAIAQGSATTTVGLRFKGGDGVWRTIESTGRGSVQGGANVIIINCRDVSDRRELEERLMHAQKLEAVGRLAGGVAHDFNNLLTAITGYGELLLGQLPEDDPRHGDALEVVRAAERAAALTGQLLAFSRRQVLQPEPLDLGATVSGMERLLAPLIGADIELVTLGEPGCVVLADRGQIEQVIANLAVNARDAMPDGGSLTIETRRARTPGGAELLVTDTGAGMDAETRALAFEPYFTTKPAGKGTGLGLATVYGIVAQSGGEIDLDSAPGRGTRFRILLPLASDEEVAAVARPAAAERLATETVLLVDDEPVIRKLVREVLDRSGYRVLEAGEGGEALALLEEHGRAIDLLLTDVAMPGMNGAELGRAAAQLHPELRILYTSGFTNEAELLLDADEANFIAKPFSPQELVRKVRTLLDAA